MSALDRGIVLASNGAIIVYGLDSARSTHTAGQWFLGSGALTWWGVGMSMFATNVDKADLAAVTGNIDNEGLHVITVEALASAVGGILAAFFVAPALRQHPFATAVPTWANPTPRAIALPAVCTWVVFGAFRWGLGVGSWGGRAGSGTCETRMRVDREEPRPETRARIRRLALSRPQADSSPLIADSH